MLSRAPLNWAPSSPSPALLFLGGAAGVVLATIALSALAMVPPPLALVGVAAAALIAAVCAHPPLGAYVLLLATPLIAGMDRGVAVPFLRPSEALTLLVGLGLLLNGGVRLLTVGVLAPRLRAVDATIVLMAVTGSVLPLLWMLARGNQITGDDFQYSLLLWKCYGIYLIFRMAVRTERQVRRCLALAMVSASIVGIVAILQSLELFGVPDLLSRYYAPFGEAEALSSNRGTSTVASSFAVADLMVISLGIAVGLLARGSRHRLVLVMALALFVFGIIASGQFSGVIGLLVGVMALGLITGRPWRVAAASVPAAVFAVLLLKPVVEHRLSGFATLSGLPVGWQGRLDNLRTYFWPELFSRFHYVLGVRPSARIDLSINGKEFVWIESGHTSLLWTGGIPLLLAFFAFLWVSIRTTARIARARTDAYGVAAIASFASLVVLAVLTTFDSHLTTRGSSDVLFALLALACAGGAPSSLGSLRTSDGPAGPHRPDGTHHPSARR
jgi:hypothetical protein